MRGFIYAQTARREGRDRTLPGDAILAAQVDYGKSGAFPELLEIYHLFGDPAMKLQ